MTDCLDNKRNPNYGGAATTYKTVTLTADSKHVNQNGWSNFHNAALNAADNAAYIARSNGSLPAYVFVIGLGGNTSGTSAPPDPILLQRMANDPTGDQFNNPAKYSPCAEETGCSTWAGEYNGQFVYAPSVSQLNSAFLVISSQILRLNQ
jgi:hypothetical protein